jgi:uncharacterized 2Fe-2S/4Fe-4S cluster protein (DUF4445 family)
MKLTFLTHEESRELEIKVQAGATVSQALRQASHPLNTRCGERGLCKACMVEVFTPDGWVAVQSCRTLLTPEMTVRASSAALLAYEPQVQSGFSLGVPLAHDPLFGSSGVGLAVDIGTTTIAVMAVDLATGKEVGRAAAFNGQIALGDDVLTRISMCLADDSAVGRLQDALVETLVRLANEALPQGDCSSAVGWVLSGNSTMLHLALGVNPKSMGSVPFKPVFLDSQTVSANEIGLPGSCPVVTLPGAAAYVGADILAGMASSGFAYGDEWGLFVDVGTNGEMVAKGRDGLIGCATAAGPAFEGSGLKCGVRAGKGAVSHLTWNDEGFFDSEVIGGEEAGRPIGLCGSAYVDFLAEARRAGVLSSGGRALASAGDILLEGDYGKEIQVALGQGKRPLVVSEPDTAALIQAKAAIAAGIKTLTKRSGLSQDSTKRLALAGGFGMHLNLVNAVRCGLLPGWQPSQISLVGNTSLGGAYAALVDGGMLADMARLAKVIDVIELNLDPEFEDTFIDCLTLEEE